MLRFSFFVVVWMPVIALASPIVSIGDSRQMSWQDGINQGLVTAPILGSLSSQTQAFYQNQINQHNLNGLEIKTPVLTPDFLVSDGSSTRQALVMSWNQPVDQNTLGVASWEWGYHADPDLTEFQLTVELLAPKGVFALGVELLDVSGRSKGWYREALPRPPFWDGSYSINLSGGLQGPFTNFGVDPGFDIKTVMKIRFNMSSLPSDPFIVPDPTGIGNAWGAFSRLDVVPEPSALLMLSAGILGLTGRRIKLNHRPK